MKYQPLFDNVIVELESPDGEVTEGGIFLPRGDDAPLTGVVLAIGPGMPKEFGDGLYPMPVNPGDRVALPGSVGYDFMYNGKPSILLRVTEIISVISD